MSTDSINTSQVFNSFDDTNESRISKQRDIKLYGKKMPESFEDDKDLQQYLDVISERISLLEKIQEKAFSLRSQKEKWLEDTMEMYQKSENKKTVKGKLQEGCSDHLIVSNYITLLQHPVLKLDEIQTFLRDIGVVYDL